MMFHLQRNSDKIRGGVMRNILLAIFFLLSIPFISSSDVSSPVVFASKTEHPVIIDGVLDEPCWKDAVKIDHFLDIYDNSKLAYPQTYFQVVYDDGNIYFGITGMEPNIADVVKEPFPRDSWPKGTSIEIFLDTNSDRATYYQFATNLGGGIFDSYNKDTKWNGNWKIATRTYNDRWSMEIAVPFSNFGMGTPKDGMRWGLNVCRNREGGIQYSSSWAAVGGDFHNPGKFNTLVFGGFDRWIKAEMENYRDLKEETLSFLKQQKQKERRIEAKIRRMDILMRDVQGMKNRIKDKKDINQILPVYYRIQKIQALSQDIKDEILVIRKLKKIEEAQQ